MIRLSKASISNNEKDAVLKVLNSEYLGMGSVTQQFELEIANYLGISESNVVCVNTGTTALHIALNCLGVGYGDEVIVPSLTYIASFQAISATGAVPVACDITEDTLFLDCSDAESKITNKTKAIMPVHYASSAKGLKQVYELAKKHNLRVVQDAAQAFGCKDIGGLVGSIGDVTCFSFDGIKNITCGEGGAVVSSDKELIDKIKDARLLGVIKDSEQRYAGKRSWDFDVIQQGFRYHMSNINAAIGIEQLKRIDSFKNKRQNIALKYINNLSNLKQITFLDLDFENIIPHIFVIKVENRNELREYLSKYGVECGLHYKPNHLLTKFKSKVPLSNTESCYPKLLTLPCHFDLLDIEQETVINLIKEYYGK